MRLKNKEQLAKLIDKLGINEGIDLKGHYMTAMNNKSELTFGIRCIRIIDSPCIIFGGYGAVHSIFDLNHDMADEIVESILKSEGLKITDLEILEDIDTF